MQHCNMISKQIMPHLTFLLVLFFYGIKAQDSIVYEITEEQPKDSYIGNVIQDANLTDKYEPEVLSSLKFNILGQGQGTELFIVQENTGILMSKIQIDRDVICPRQIDCSVTLDVAISPAQYFMTIPIQIVISDINDNHPSFPSSNFVVHVSETTAPGAYFSLPLASDMDSGLFGVQSYHLTSSSNEFELKQTATYEDMMELGLNLKMSLDRELSDFYQITVVATDGGSPPKTGTLLVTVNVEDANDHRPVFDNKLYSVTLPENTKLGTEIVQVVATDKDVDVNGQILYSFTSSTISDYGHLFEMQNSTGKIIVKSTLDFENHVTYVLSIVATDQGPYSLTDNAKVIVQLTDVNDNAPQISVNSLTQGGGVVVLEESPVGTFVVHLSVSDLDQGTNKDFSCYVSGDHFALEPLPNPSQFKIITLVQLDREEKSEYNVTIHCTDEGLPPQSSEKVVSVSVLDKNDNPPVFQSRSITTTVHENIKIGSAILVVNATDKDADMNGEINYRIQNDNSLPFSISRQTGVLRVSDTVDYEKQKSVHFTVIAYDQGSPSFSATTEITVNIKDTNDEMPYFTQEELNFGVFENKLPGTEVGVVTASDADSPPYNGIRFSLTDNKTFSIDEKSGIITTLKELDREEQSVFYVKVIATDTSSPFYTTSVTVTVYVADENDNNPEFLFPTEDNHTAFVSNMVPPGYLITRVRAVDSDLGPNSSLNFSISDGNKEGYFHLNPDSGFVTVAKKLNTISHQEFRVVIIAQDFGNPPKMAASLLSIVVNDSIVSKHYAPSLTSGTSKSDTNVTIVIAVVAVSLVIIIILLIAIIFVKCMDNAYKKNRKYQPHYIYTVEANTMLSEPSTTGKEEKENIEIPRKGNTNGMGTKGGQDDPRLQEKPISKNDQNMEMYPYHQNEHFLKEKRTNEMLDDTSFRSDISCTDSGHGASEEGERFNTPKTGTGSFSKKRSFHEPTLQTTGCQRYQASLALQHRHTQQDDSSFHLPQYGSGRYMPQTSFMSDSDSVTKNNPKDPAKEYLNYNRQRADLISQRAAVHGASHHSSFKEHSNSPPELPEKTKSNPQPSKWIDLTDDESVLILEGEGSVSCRDIIV